MKIIPLIALTLTLTAACSSRKAEKTSAPQNGLPASRTAPANIGDAVKPGAAGAAGSSITWKKSELGKAYLMSMSVSDSENSARVDVMLPKVVSFALNGSELGMLEQNIYSISEEVPTGKLLQSFPVESQTAETVTFKWNYGLASLPYKPMYVASDDVENASSPHITADEDSLTVIASYLKESRIRDNRLELRQLTRVRKETGTIHLAGVTLANKETTAFVDIAISPYRINPSFQRRLSTKQQGVGFFEVAQVRKGEGTVDIYASRWDLSKEAGLITYRISKTAPADAVDAMKEGVLYWNKVSQAAIGRDIIKVETGADPQEAPGHRTVMVYWVPWSTAGMAYANFQPDPITGEITSGLVYQTDVFYLSGKQRGRRYVNRGVENKKALAPVGFRSAAVCNLEEPVLHGKDPLVDDTIDEKMARKMGLDYLRHVVAHEVGHTLGFRHNFAGSLASELPTPESSAEKFKDYLGNHEHKGAVTSSSIMEYTTFRDSVLNGAAISDQKAFAYDKAAFEWGYGEKVMTAEEIRAPLFCTDIELAAKKTFGCSSDDSGPRPVAGHAASAARGRALAAVTVLEAILDAIRPDNEADAVSVRKVLALPSSHPDKIAGTLSADFPHFIRLGSPGMKAISVDREAGGSNWANEKEYNEKTEAFIQKEFEHVGGLPGILRVAYGLDESFKLKKGWLTEDVLARMGRAEFSRGKNIAGKPYELTGIELAEIRGEPGKPGVALRLAEAVENAHLRNLLLLVTGHAGKPAPEAIMAYPDATTTTWAPHVVQDSWAAPLAALAEQIATESDGEIQGTIDGTAVKVPKPKFSFEVRLAAMRFFSPKVFGARTPDTWMKDAEASLAQAMVTRLAPVTKLPEGNPDKAEPVGKNISKELVDWAKRELTLLKALKAARK